MTSHSRLVTVAGLGILAVTLSLTGVGQALAEVVKPVEVVNTAGEPVPVRDVDHPSRRPIFLRCLPTNDTACELFTVPDDTLLVIEMFSGQVRLDDSGHLLLARLIVDSPSEDTLRNTFAVPVSTGPTAGGDPFFVFSQLTRVYAEAGTTVSVSTSVVGGSFGSGLYSVSGHLVNCGNRRVGQIGCTVP